LRACAANQSSKAETSWEFLVLGFEFKNLPNREIHEIREKEMKKLRRNYRDPFAFHSNLAATHGKTIDRLTPDADADFCG
jgi:hypothetical protein